MTRRQAGRRGAIAVCALALVVGGCGSDESGGESDRSRPFAHTMGTTEVPVAPKRVASLNDFFLTTNLLDLGYTPAGSATSSGKITAADHDVSGIERLGNSDDLNVERVARVKPDLIIGTQAANKAQYARLSGIAPTVLLSDDEPIVEFNRKLADLVGKVDEHETLVSDVQQRTRELRGRLRARLPRLEVSAISADSDQIFTFYGPGNAYSVAFQRLGLRFPNGKLPPSGETFSLERLNEFDADVLFVMSDGINEDWLRRQPLFRTLNAARKKQVFTVDYNLWTGTRLAAIPKIYDELERRLISSAPDISADFR